MNKKPSTLLLLLLVIPLCFSTLVHSQTTQVQKLNNLFHAKMRNEIDTSSSRLKVVKNEEIASGVIVDHAPPGSKEDDLIVRLPGQPIVSFKQYGGYISVNADNGRNLYYYFVEAHHPNKDKLPLVLWLNGGPGCSSLGYGALTELGPFRVGSDSKTLHLNRYAWNNAANILFLESPAGVGFSYSDTPSDYTTGDTATAENNFVFLLNWFSRFPEYRGRDFFITGESYAGHYVTQMAHTILMHKDTIPDNPIKLKGIMVGNAVLNDETDNKGMYNYLGYHGLASLETVASVEKNCDFSPFFRGNQTPICDAALYEVDRSIAPIFAYNIYEEQCPVHKGSTTQKPVPFSIIEYDECSPNYVQEYLNKKEVQKAMHANKTNIPRPWSCCADNIHYTESATSVLPEIEFLLANEISVWIYSGDMDGRVPFTSSQYSIKTMNLTVDTKFHAWFIAGEVGGYTEAYKEGLRFATVRGAGHEVPSYQPLRALSLFMHFLDNTPLPNSKKYMA
ncbi:Serine carboxypeptidase-like 40 [Linum perenne]